LVVTRFAEAEDDGAMFAAAHLGFAYFLEYDCIAPTGTWTFLRQMLGLGQAMTVNHQSTVSAVTTQRQGSAAPHCVGALIPARVISSCCAA